MSGGGDEYLAQLDRALEHLEATRIDVALAAEHAPHLLQSAPGAASETATSGYERDLAASLLQTNVEVSLQVSTSDIPDSVEDSGLDATMVYQARTMGDASSASRPQPPAAANGAGGGASRAAAAGNAQQERSPVSSLMLLDSQDVSSLEPESSLSTPPPVSLSGAPTVIAHSGTIDSFVGHVAPPPSRRGAARRRGLFSAAWPANIVIAGAIATWLALWPAYSSTQSWLSERSHAGLEELARPHLPGTQPVDADALSKEIMGFAGEASGRFFWRWGLLAMAGTLLLALPYLRQRQW